MKPQRAVASFDSASAMLRVQARHLHGKSSPGLGLGPTARAAARPVLPGVNRLPSAARQQLYSWAGISEAVPQHSVGDIDAEAVANWVTGHYPRRRYPAVLIGSSSGAAIHLAALAGVPWLPQTLLVPVRQHGIHPDEPSDALATLAATRDAFVAANPQLALHHMHDANQDRLMIRGMAYFRFKYRHPPNAYVDFLRRWLQPGGTVLVTDCEQRWPTTTAGRRQVFQHGAVGGATPDEYQHGGPRVARFLTDQGCRYRHWDGPEPDGSSPEAEWGVDPEMLPELSRLCAEQGWRLERLRFDHPGTLGGPVADLHRAWYAERGVDPNRLLVGCFALMDAHLPLLRGLVPYWTTFGTRPARDTLLAYLAGRRPFDEIDLGLFSHGISSVGLAGIEEWDDVPRRARRRGGYAGVDRQAYPQDFASNIRFHDQVAQRTGSPVPHPAPWPWVSRSLAQLGEQGVDYGPVDGLG